MMVEPARRPTAQRARLEWAYTQREWAARAADRRLALWAGWTDLHFALNACRVPRLMGTAPDGETACVPHYAASLTEGLALLTLAGRWRSPVSLRPTVRGEWYLEIGIYEGECSLAELPALIVAMLLTVLDGPMG